VTRDQKKKEDEEDSDAEEAAEEAADVDADVDEDAEEAAEDVTRTSGSPLPSWAVWSRRERSEASKRSSSSLSL